MEYRLGIDLGGTAVKAGIVNEDYEIIARASCPAVPGPKGIVKSIASAAREVCELAHINLSYFTSMGVGSPGILDPEKGILIFSGNCQLENTKLAAMLEKELGIEKVYLGNDANCAVIGEALAGGGKGCANVLMVTLGTGVGGGIVMGNKLFLGGDGKGAEIGHTPMIYGGEPCSCGSTGCFEAYASVTALLRQAKAAMEIHPESSMNDWVAEKGPLCGLTVFECAHEGDPTALAVLDQYEDYVAYGIAGLVTTFRPDVVLVGGGISAQGEYLLAPIREKLNKYVFASRFVGAPEVRTATLANDAGIIGAAYIDRM